MNIIEKLINIGVVRIDFDNVFERSEFEINYLLNQREVIYYFTDYKCFSDEKNSNELIYQLNLFF